METFETFLVMLVMLPSITAVACRVDARLECVEVSGVGAVKEERRSPVCL